MDIMLFESFLKICQTGSFSKAADELFITQSALTKHIKKLEHEFDTVLFIRNTRNVQLTHTGEILRAECEKVVNEYRSLCRKMDSETSEIKIAALPVMDFYGITELVGNFKKQVPDSKLFVREAENSELFSLVKNGDVDFAFVRVSKDNKEFMSFPEICTDRLCVAVNSRRFSKYQGEIDLKLLKDENFIMLGKGTLLYEESLEACRTSGFEPKIIYSGSSVQSIVRLVEEDSGAAIFMKKIALSSATSKISVLDFKSAPESKIILFFDESSPLSEKKKLFLHFVKQISDNKKA